MILLIAIVLFSQMFFTLLAPDSCAVEETRDNTKCSQNEYYLKVCGISSSQRFSLLCFPKVYAILLGDFGLFQRENFTSGFSTALAVLYTFMVVLVLLNVLIAVASDSVCFYKLIFIIHIEAQPCESVREMPFALAQIVWPSSCDDGCGTGVIPEFASSEHPSERTIFFLSSPWRSFVHNLVVQ